MKKCSTTKTPLLGEFIQLFYSDLYNSCSNIDLLRLIAAYLLMISGRTLLLHICVQLGIPSHSHTLYQKTLHYSIIRLCRTELVKERWKLSHICWKTTTAEYAETWNAILQEIVYLMNRNFWTVAFFHYKITHQTRIQCNKSTQLFFSARF